MLTVVIVFFVLIMNAAGFFALSRTEPNRVDQLSPYIITVWPIVLPYVLVIYTYNNLKRAVIG